MKRLSLYLTILLSLTMIVSVTSCDPDDDPIQQPAPNPAPSPDPDPNPDPQPPVTGNAMKITVGSTTFTVALADNPTSTAFKAMLPMTINMSELNSNEKYYDLPNTLPTNASNPGSIQNGDLMLYGSGTLVLFYKTFATSYSYTRIGSVDHPSGLQTALGTGNVTVTFELQ